MEPSDKFVRALQVFAVDIWDHNLETFLVANFLEIYFTFSVNKIRLKRRDIWMNFLKSIYMDTWFNFDSKVSVAFLRIVIFISLIRNPLVIIKLDSDYFVFETLSQFPGDMLTFVLVKIMVKAVNENGQCFGNRNIYLEKLLDVAQRDQACSNLTAATGMAHFVWIDSSGMIKPGLSIMLTSFVMIFESYFNVSWLLAEFYLHSHLDTIVAGMISDAANTTDQKLVELVLVSARLHEDLTMDNRMEVTKAFCSCVYAAVELVYLLCQKIGDEAIRQMELWQQSNSSFTSYNGK